MLFNLFLANVPIFMPLKTPDFLGYKIGTLAKNGLMLLGILYSLFLYATYF